jgi:threonine/homoserine efflux transporter RhtA
MAVGNNDRASSTRKPRNTLMKINFSLSNMEPALALISGILILIMPQLLNLIVAIYLIVIGALGLTSYRS